jgi:hypothetical protein
LVLLVQFVFGTRDIVQSSLTIYWPNLLNINQCNQLNQLNDHNDHNDLNDLNHLNDINDLNQLIIQPIITLNSEP